MIATIFTTTRGLAILVLASAGIIAAAAAHAGPQITFYLTVPLDGPSIGHVLGLRLDRSPSAPDIHNINPASPLNRRPWLDLQFGKDSALRLELDRRLTWDINGQQWHESSRPATVTLRVPTHHAASTPGERAAYAATLADPLKDQRWMPAPKPLVVQP